MKTRIILFFTLLLMVNVVLIAQTPEWQWATQAGGTSFDEGSGITVDKTGNCYVTGNFNGTATFGSDTLTSSGSYDIFVAKMDSKGNWQWATKAGGTGNDSGNGITIDDAGNNYVTGNFNGTATFGSDSLTSSGNNDVFVAKIDSMGNWQWAAKAGGPGWEYGRAIIIDDARNSYITGSFKETATFGPYTITGSGGYDIFVAKVDVKGNWQWATKAGGTGYDGGNGITIDNARNCYVTGYFEESATFGSYSLTSSGNFEGDIVWCGFNPPTYDTDIFVAKIDADGNWQWATKADGTGRDEGIGITIDKTGNCYVTGYFKETATFGSDTVYGIGDKDIFVAKMDSKGNWQWAIKAGSNSGFDSGYGITIDDSGNSYVIGCFKGKVSFGYYTLTSRDWISFFIAKIDSKRYCKWATKSDGFLDVVGYGITIDNAGNCYVTGHFGGTANFGSHSLTSSHYDIFVAKLKVE